MLEVEKEDIFMAKKKGMQTGKDKQPAKRYLKEETVTGDVSGRAGKGMSVTTVDQVGPKGGKNRRGATLIGGTDLPRGKGGTIGSIADTPMFKALRKRGFSTEEATSMVKSERKGGGGFSILQGKRGGKKPRK
jgi:hypothetical protein